MSRFQNKILFAGLYVEMFLQFFVWLDRRLNVKYVVRNIEEIYYEVYFVENVSQIFFIRPQNIQPRIGCAASNMGLTIGA